MAELKAEDLFDAVKNAQDAGILELLPPMKREIRPGDRFFESFQSYLLETINLEKLDQAFYYLAPTIAYMADPKHWIPEEFTSDEMFLAVLHMQQMGLSDVIRMRSSVPGAGDRFFEHYQDILVNQIGVEKMDRLLHVFGQCIRFLATDAALENMMIPETI
ncbi:MAG: hypothetical protein LIO96_14620 [Lachnospiraceae bacterium]|nr:hypothetical protein [Lachnospiraceae bacterium]